MSLALQGKFKALIPHQSQRLFSPGIFDGSEIEEFPSTFSGLQCLCREVTLQTTLKEVVATQKKIWALPHPGPYRWFLTCQ